MSLLTSEEIKSMALDLGADQCGIARAERYDEAPDGFHPHGYLILRLNMEIPRQRTGFFMHELSLEISKYFYIKNLIMN